jgi:hypothetical protein
MTFNINRSNMVESPRHPAPGEDFLTQRVVYEAEDDGSGSTLGLVVVNTTATITT